jgi:hypothetical protein
MRPPLLLDMELVLSRSSGGVVPPLRESKRPPFLAMRRSLDSSRCLSRCLVPCSCAPIRPPVNMLAFRSSRGGYESSRTSRLGDGLPCGPQGPAALQGFPLKLDELEER